MSDSFVQAVCFKLQQVERRRHAGLIRDALAEAKSRGVSVGRPEVLDDAGKTHAIALRATGMAWRAIARELGVSVNTIRRVCGERMR